MPLFNAGLSAEWDGVNWVPQAAPTPNSVPLPEPHAAVLLLVGGLLASLLRR